MDEPTAALVAAEVERLFAVVAPLRTSGVSVIYISHRLEEIFELCDARHRAPRRPAASARERVAGPRPTN